MAGLTLAAPARHAMEVRQSRFLAQAAAVATPEQALAWLRAASDAGASHNCWAWRIGDDYRSSDDGEPAGTAGRPILAAIDGQGCDRVAVLVTRWFGGIKLGAGGLVRAYGGAAAECLRGAERVPIVELVEAELGFPFADTGAVHALLDAGGIEKHGEAFVADGVRLRIRLPADALAPLRARLRDATRGRARITLATGP